MSNTARAPAAVSPSRFHPLRLIGGLVLLSLIVLILLFRWNWFRGPLAAAMSARLHRPVSIVGDLEVHPWSWSPTVVIHDLRIGGNGGAGSPPLAIVPRLLTRFRLLSVLTPHPHVERVEIDQPALSLRTGADGRANWTTSVPSAPPRPGSGPRVDRLVIAGGTARYDDARRGAHFDAAIAGDESATGGGTTLDAHGAVAGAPWAGRAPLAVVPSLRVRLRLLSALSGPVAIDSLEADKPAVNLMRDASGRASWDVTPKAAAKPLKLPAIHRLVINDGHVRYADLKRKLTFAGVITSSETVDAAGRGVFLLTGQGRLNGAAFTASLRGGPLIHVDASRPYLFDASLRAGADKVTASGAIAHPFDFSAVSGALRVSGPDLADLYGLTGLALPNTPPYDLAADFRRAGKRVDLTRLRGRLGGSDVEGRLDVDDVAGRPTIGGDLASHRLRLADFAAVFGAAPKGAPAAMLSPAQKIMKARLTAQHRVLPDSHLDVTRVRDTDAHVTYHAQSVEAGRLPIRGVALTVDLDHGDLRVDPLSLTLPAGRIAGRFGIDARPATPAVSLDLSLSNGRLENLVPPGKPGTPPPLEGGLYARARLSGQGDSVRAAAATANGDISLVVPHGEMRQAFAELLGIDATKGLFLLLAKNQTETPIRCGIADFQARDGVFTARRVILDTGVVQAIGSGQIDLRDEKLSLRLAGKPKKFRLVRLGAPITLGGDLAAPRIGVDIGKAAPQLAIGAAAGVLLAPLAAILPFVAPGLAKDADCAALVASDRETEGVPRQQPAAH